MLDDLDGDDRARALKALRTTINAHARDRRVVYDSAAWIIQPSVLSSQARSVHRNTADRSRQAACPQTALTRGRCGAAAAMGRDGGSYTESLWYFHQTLLRNVPVVQDH